MITAEPTITLPPSHHKALQRAIRNLENPDFAAQLADYAGQPISRALRLMPKAATDRFNRVVEAAILDRSTSPSARSSRNRNGRRRSARPRCWPASAAASAAFSGFAALPIELPVTTTLMLRAIADIARHHGEDLSTLEARLACVEVFALGAPEPAGRRTDFGYYAVAGADRPAGGRRHRASSLERSVANLSAPVVGSLVTRDRHPVRRRRLRALGGERACRCSARSAAPP